MYKILIIRLSSFGDIVLTYPLINELNKAFPESQIDFLTKSQYKELVRLHPHVNNIISFNNESLSEIRSNINEYDIIIDLHKNIRSYLFTLFISNLVVHYKKQTFKKLLLVVSKINLFKEVIPVYKKYLLSIHKLLNYDNYEYSNTNLIKKSQRIITENYVVISPSSKHFTKTLPEEKFAEIIENIQNKKIVIVGDNSKTDKDICEYLSANCDNVINYCGKTDFEKLTNILYYSDLVICNDSGVLHLAESLGKKVIVFFGSTVKEFGFFPQLESTKVVENINLNCRPCTHIGKSYCPKKHFKCMRDLQTENIFIE